MRRLATLFPLWLALLVAVVALFSPTRALAAPEAHIMRIDPRASQADGAPVLTTVLELVQTKRMSDAIAECAPMRGDAQLDCQSEKLEAPQALYSPMAPFPDQAAIFTVSVDGTDRPASFVSKARWGDSLTQPGIGTAWLIVIDAAATMGARFQDAKTIASAFVGALGQNDIVDVTFFNDRQVVSDSKWQPASAKAQMQGFVAALKGTYPSQGRVRPLFDVIRNAATNAFRDLGNSGTNIPIPLHQAMVVLSNGYAGGDAQSTGPAALTLSGYLSKGRFPEDNTVQPKSPVPVISVWLPSGGFDEFRQNAQEFMQGLANVDIGGFYDVVRTGQGADKAPKLVNTVRTRFNQMHIVKWRVSCLSPTVTQSFKLVFSNTNPPILGDSTFKDVPLGIDPTSWPLDINVDYSQQGAKRDPVMPGGKLTVYGNFCWGGEKDRAEVYFVPVGSQVPAAMAGTDVGAAQRAQQQLIQSGMRGTVVQSSDSDATFIAPDKDKILWGSGEPAVVHLVVYDNKAHRASGVTASTILTLKGSDKEVPWLLIIGGAFGAVVVLLLVLVLFSRGGKRRGGSAPLNTPAPIVAGGAAYAGAGGGFAPPGGGGYAPQGGGGHAPPGAGGYPPQAHGGGGPGGYAPQASPGAPPAADFMYGGKPPQYGLTSQQPATPQMPPSPYGGGGGSSRATLTGAGGVYTVMPGYETQVGREARCQIILSEPRLSGVHASLKMEAGQLYARDETSNNGTFVNGMRIPPGVWTVVPDGAALRFGPIEFGVRFE